MRNKEDILIKDLLLEEMAKELLEQREFLRNDAKKNIKTLQSENRKTYITEEERKLRYTKKNKNDNLRNALKTPSAENAISAIKQLAFPAKSLIIEPMLPYILEEGISKNIPAKGNSTTILSDLNINSLEDCDIHFSYVQSHSGNLGNDRVDQLAKETT
ncbi:hypothetical protein TNCV_2894431 [Trichonephila clavipes]|nr:hypothetical protein TNCV_2894431 [Trichonephila clavipes]